MQLIVLHTLNSTSFDLNPHSLHTTPLRLHWRAADVGPRIGRRSYSPQDCSSKGYFADHSRCRATALTDQSEQRGVSSRGQTSRSAHPGQSPDHCQTRGAARGRARSGAGAAAVFITVSMLSMAPQVTAQCPNSCNGHGTCGDGNACICFPGYVLLNLILKV